MDWPADRPSSSHAPNDTNESVGAMDLAVFAGLETLGTLAIVGNLSLIVVLLRNKYLNRASFILMLSLAIADVLHGLVTTCYFYPPIILKRQHIPPLGMRLFNIVDWTAWAITLTHMSAICLDRLIAIMLYDRYSILVTIPRVRWYSIFCWVSFLGINIAIFFMKFCCIIQPLRSENYYTFGYDTHTEWNFYVLSYTPLEIITIGVLSVSNPITLVQLYRRHKRKVALRMQGTQKVSADSNPSLLKSQRSQWQRASTMLLEMSMKMGNRQVSNDVREIAARRANRQQQRILLQISVVALIFYSYMAAYYMSYYVAFLQSTATMIFNSFFYSTTHMINPIIYFSMNKEMRQQLKQAINDFAECCFCRRPSKGNFASSNSKMATMRECTVDRVQASGTSETSPLFSTNCHYKYKYPLSRQHTTRSTGPVEESVVKKEVIPEVTPDAEAEEMEPSSETQTAKLLPRDRSNFINDLIKALQYESQPTLNSSSSEIESQINRQRHSMEFPKRVRGRYMKMSSTLQLISNNGDPPSAAEAQLFVTKKFSSMNFDRTPLLSKNDSDDELEIRPKNRNSDVPDCNGNAAEDSDEEIAYL
ncbi:unnamed protein product, partial [Mesorhabditis spiculigera]